MKTIAVVSTKGGSGKTTVALSLAVAAFRRGRRVMMADIDPQRSSVYALKAREEPGPEAVPSTGGKLFQIRNAAERGGLDLLVVDTPGHMESEIVEAVRIADLCLVVARPTFLDLAASVHTAEMLRSLGKTAMAVVNQAPPKRMGADAPASLNAMSALRMMGLEPAPVAICARAAFQASIGHGQSAEEWPEGDAAAAEIAALWTVIDQRLWASPAQTPPRPMFIPAPPALAADVRALVV